MVDPESAAAAHATQQEIRRSPADAPGTHRRRYESLRSGTPGNPCRNQGTPESSLTSASSPRPPSYPNRSAECTRASKRHSKRLSGVFALGQPGGEWRKSTSSCRSSQTPSGEDRRAWQYSRRNVVEPYRPARKIRCATRSPTAIPRSLAVPPGTSKTPRTVPSE